MTLVNTRELSAAEAAGHPRSHKGSSSSAVIYGATFATEFLVVLAQIALYKLAANWLGQTGFSEYALVRRVIALLQPMAMLGMGVGLPRYLALAEGRGDADRSAQYLWATVLCVGGFTAALSIPFMIWRGWFSFLFFGDAQHQPLMAPLVLMLVGMSLHAIVYAFFRGKLAVGWANALQVINLCLLPLGLMVRFHQNAANFLWYLGLAWTTVAGIALVFTPLRHGWKNPLKESRELLSYGLQRVPGDFALIALLALPAIFAAHLGGIHQAGLVAFGLAIVNMIGSVFSPVGIVLLPKISRAIGNGDFRYVHREIVLVSRLTLALSSVFLVLIEILGGRLIRIYLGPSFADARGIVAILAIGALPLSYYYALRSVIDASFYRAVNAINLVAALILFLAGAGIGAWSNNSQFLLWSSSAALGVLALLTQREIHKIFKSGVLPTVGAASAVVMGIAGEAVEGKHAGDWERKQVNSSVLEQ
jgi:O-antigen/teichoic acid export membrane protein